MRRKAQAAIETNASLETVGFINWAKDGSREKEGVKNGIKTGENCADLRLLRRRFTKCTKLFLTESTIVEGSLTKNRVLLARAVCSMFHKEVFACSIESYALEWH